MLPRLVITFLPRSKCLLNLWPQSPSAVILEPPKIKPITVSTVSPSICHEVMGPNAIILVFWMLSFKPTFSPLSLSSRDSLVLLHFMAKVWYHLHIWGYWYFSQQSWFQLVLLPAQNFSWGTYSACTLNKQGDNIQPWQTPFPIWNQSVFLCSSCSFLTCIQTSQEASQVVWYSQLFKKFLQFIVIHTAKDFGIVNKAEVDVFLERFAFSLIQCILAVWSLVPLTFPNPAWTSGSSQFTYCWSLAWKILSIPLLACDMSAIVQ